jgi:hypothetical protein
MTKQSFCLNRLPRYARNDQILLWNIKVIGRHGIDSRIRGNDKILLFE